MSEAADTRAPIYDFIYHRLGVHLSNEQKGELKKLLIANVNATAEDLLKQLGELREAHEKLKLAKIKKVFIRVRAQS